MKKKKEESYRLTFKGFVHLYSGYDNGQTDAFIDALELWLRRIDCNSIILTKAGEFETHKVYLDETQ